MPDQITQALTGPYTHQTMWLLTAGIAAIWRARLNVSEGPHERNSGDCNGGRLHA